MVAELHIHGGAAVAKEWWQARRTLRGHRFTDAVTWWERRAVIVRQAQRLTRLAIKRGILAHPSEFDCADCGDAASCYDHRDYRRPLWVTPLCNSCNGRRPTALPWAPRPNNTYREEELRISERRPLAWDEDSDLYPTLPPLEALTVDLVAVCPTCGHASPRKEQAA